MPKNYFILFGLPGSGKSYYTGILKGCVKDYKILSRDFLRTRPDGTYVYDPLTEEDIHIQFLKEVEAVVNDRLVDNVIIDDANIRWEEIVSILLQISLSQRSAQVFAVIFEPLPYAIHMERVRMNSHNVPFDKFTKLKSMYYETLPKVKEQLAYVVIKPDFDYPMQIDYVTPEIMERYDDACRRCMLASLSQLHFAISQKKGLFNIFTGQVKAELKMEIVKGYSNRTRIIPQVYEAPVCTEIPDDFGAGFLDAPFLNFEELLPKGLLDPSPSTSAPEEK